MAAIGERAGVTPALVNHYFGTKRELYLAVLREAAAEISAVVRTDLDGLPLTERVSRNLDEFLDSVERDRGAWRLLFGARSRSDPDVARFVAVVRGQTIARMARNNAGEAEPSAELLLGLRIFQGAAEAAAEEWLSGRAERAQVRAILNESLLALLTRVVGVEGA